MTVPVIRLTDFHLCGKKPEENEAPQKAADEQLKLAKTKRKKAS